MSSNVYVSVSENLPWNFVLNSNTLTGDEQNTVWISVPNNGASNISLSIPYVIEQYGTQYQWNSNGYYTESCINPFLPKGFICSIAQMADSQNNYYTNTSGTIVTNRFAYGSIDNSNCATYPCNVSTSFGFKYVFCPEPSCTCNYFNIDSFDNWTPILSSQQSTNYLCGPFLSFNPPDGSNTPNNNLTLTGNLYYCGLGNGYDASNALNGVVSSINVVLASNNGSSYINAFQMITNLPYQTESGGLSNFTTTAMLVPYIDPITNNAYVGIADFYFTIPNASTIGPACFNRCPSGSNNATDGSSGYIYVYSNSDIDNPNLASAINNGYTNVPTSQQCFFIDPAGIVSSDIFGETTGSPLTIGRFSIASSEGIAQVPSITITLGKKTFTYTYSGYITYSFGGLCQSFVNSTYPCMGQVNYINNPNNSTLECTPNINKNTFNYTKNGIQCYKTSYTVASYSTTQVPYIANFSSSLYYTGSYNASMTSIQNNYPQFLFGSPMLYQENNTNGTSLYTDEVYTSPSILLSTNS